MTERVEQYLRNADKCFELAKRLGDPESKHSLFLIANAWLMLAAQRAKNVETMPYSFTCPRCQSGMVWYNANLNDDRTLQQQRVAGCTTRAQAGLDRAFRVELSIPLI